MERLYREAPLNGIWEGTGNVICLDVLRAMQREPETVTVFLDEVRRAKGANARLDAFTDEVERRLTKALRVRAGGAAHHRDDGVRAAGEPAACATPRPRWRMHFAPRRLDGDWGQAFGTLPKGLDTQAIVDRATVTA